MLSCFILFKIVFLSTYIFALSIGFSLVLNIDLKPGYDEKCNYFESAELI